MIEDQIDYDKPNTAGCGRMIIGLLLLVVLGYAVYLIRQASLKKEGQIVTAKVVDYAFGRGSASLIVTFDYNNEVYRKGAWTSVTTDRWPQLVGHSFPALYTAEEGVIMLLVYPEDFKKYNIKPDSISVWVRDHLMY